MTDRRDEVIEVLAVLAGPLGPPVEPLADLDERLAFQQRWIDAGGVELLDMIFELIASPPPAEELARHLHPVHAENWTALLIEIAGILGRRYPDLAMRRLQLLLADERTRPTALEIVEELQLPKVPDAN